MITPHKGGRSDRIYLRATPETKESLQRIAETHGLSTADLVERWVAGGEALTGMSEIEQVAVALLMDSNPHNPFLSAYVEALTGDLGEQRPLDTFIWEERPLDKYPETLADGWEYQQTQYDRDRSTFSAIIDFRPRGRKETGYEKRKAIRDSYILRLAHALSRYREDGYADGATTIADIRGTRTFSPLARAVIDYHKCFG